MNLERLLTTSLLRADNGIGLLEPNTSHVVQPDSQWDSVRERKTENTTVLSCLANLHLALNSDMDKRGNLALAAIRVE
jgi:hypothetical protein